MTYLALDLFSGTGSATRYFRESDKWEVVGIDKNPNLESDIESDVLNFDVNEVNESVDFVWASPPCKSFSVANIYNNWSLKSKDLRLPKSKKALKGVELVFYTLYIIENLNPTYWFLENPRGGLRKIIGEPQADERRSNMPDRCSPGTVTYCQFGDDRMKPTDLWGVHPESFEYPFCSKGADCHNSATRGSDEGTQGRNKGADRWRVPDGLAKAVFDAVNNSLSNQEVEE
jgi:hypothetical protein